MAAPVPIADPAIFGVVFGAALLLWGRRLFWLLVAVSGFLAGWHFAGGLVPERALLPVALVAGLIGAVLALALQKFAVVFTGLILGGFFVFQALEMLDARLQPAAAWLAAGVGAVLGAVLLVTLFNWALILLSSVLGAALLLRGAHFQRGVGAAAAVALVLLGIGVQSRFFARRADDPAG